VTESNRSSNPAEPEGTSPGSLSAESSIASGNDAPASLARPDDSSNSSDAHGATSTAVGMAIGIDPRSVERIEKLVAEVVEAVVSARPDGPDHDRILEAIEHLGEREFLATAALSGRVLDRRFQSMNSQLTGRGPMARRLAELRKAAEELDPSRVRLGGGRSSAAQVKELDRYFDRFAKTQPRLESVIAELNQSRFVLERDNAAIESEEAQLSGEMEALREHVLLAERLDGALTSRLDRIAVADPQRADFLRSRVLFALKARRNQILTQLAIATQGYAALRVVEDSNREVLRAVASAVSTTGAALRTAVLAAQAAATQRMAIEHLEAARQARGAMADQALALEAGIAAGAGQAAALSSAWDDVRAALDRVEEQKARALRSISTADRELTRPKP
jgi:uncharacterized protein YaaN involved in tellurite resistance